MYWAKMSRTTAASLSSIQTPAGSRGRSGLSRYAEGGLVQGSNLPLVWTGAAYGVLSQYYTPGVPSNGANVNYGKIQAAINQMFAISPYIQK